MKNPFPKLPIIFIPRWAMTKWWAISIRDVVKYPVGVLEIPETSGKSFDTGENDILGYYEVLKIRANLLNNKIFFPAIYSWVEDFTFPPLEKGEEGGFYGFFKRINYYQVSNLWKLEKGTRIG